MSNILTIAQTVWLELLRRKDIYIILILQGFLTLMLTTLDAFGTEVPSTYIMDIGMMMAFLFSIILSIALGSRQLPEEIRTGTIYSTLIKPVKRIEFLLGKWFGLWSGMALANVLFYLIVTVISVAKGFSLNAAILMQVLCLHSCLLGIIIGICLFFTLFLSQGAGATSAGIFITLCYLLLPKIPNLLTFESGWRSVALGTIYFIAPHLELFDMRARLLHDWGALNSSVFIGTLAYGFLLITAVLSLSWIFFSKKQFKRGSVL